MKAKTVEVESESATPAPPATRAHEVIAEERGMLAVLTDAGAFGGRLNLKHPPYAAARAFRAWPIGFEVTEADFDAAVAEAARQPIR